MLFYPYPFDFLFSLLFLYVCRKDFLFWRLFRKLSMCCFSGTLNRVSYQLLRIRNLYLSLGDYCSILTNFSEVEGTHIFSPEKHFDALLGYLSLITIKKGCQHFLTTNCWYLCQYKGLVRFCSSGSSRRLLVVCVTFLIDNIECCHVFLSTSLTLLFLP